MLLQTNLTHDVPLDVEIVELKEIKELKISIIKKTISALLFCLVELFNLIFKKFMLMFVNLVDYITKVPS